jgi:hypothetical protein
MKTAVEWFQEQFNKYYAFSKEEMQTFDMIFNEAKEMEKEQRIKAYQLGYDTGYKVCEMKFNGLFKSE